MIEEYFREVARRAGCQYINGKFYAKGKELFVDEKFKEVKIKRVKKIPTEEQRQKQKQAMRNWYQRNKEKQRLYYQNYWKNKKEAI